MNLDVLLVHLQYLRNNHSNLTKEQAQALLMEVYRLELILLTHVQKDEHTDDHLALSPLPLGRLP